MTPDAAPGGAARDPYPARGARSSLLAQAWEATLRFRPGTSDASLPLAHRVDDVAPRADASSRVVALTFDDGPDRRYTPAILEALAVRHAKATFFMIGEAAASCPALVAEVAEQGHSVAGHSWSHRRLNGLSRRGFALEVDRTHDVLASLTGQPVRLIRPPYGCRNARIVNRLTARGLTTVLWSVDPKDWQATSAQSIADAVAADVGPGAIVLLHDGGGDRRATVAALPIILDDLARAGYELATL